MHRTVYGAETQFWVRNTSASNCLWCKNKILGSQYKCIKLFMVQKQNSGFEHIVEKGG
jgi:hypothetical protein